MSGGLPLKGAALQRREDDEKDGRRRESEPPGTTPVQPSPAWTRLLTRATARTTSPRSPCLHPPRQSPAPGQRRDDAPAIMASPPVTRPAKSSHDEKFVHIRLAVRQ